MTWPGCPARRWAITVPVLYELFRFLDVPDTVRMQLCVGTSLAIIVPTAVRSYRVHRAKGLVLPEVMRDWAVPSVVGVVVGSVSATFAPSGVFKIAFVLIAGLVAPSTQVAFRRAACASPGAVAMMRVISPSTTTHVMDPAVASRAGLQPWTNSVALWTRVVSIDPSARACELVRLFLQRARSTEP